MTSDFVPNNYMKIFLICPIEFASEEDEIVLDNYVCSLESKGYQVHYPARDTQQIDSTGGYDICSDNLQAIKGSNEVHIYWIKKSRGSLFDFGMAFNEHKTKGMPIKISKHKRC